jgi:hypothetical protein
MTSMRTVFECTTTVFDLSAPTYDVFGVPGYQETGGVSVLSGRCLV